MDNSMMFNTQQPMMNGYYNYQGMAPQAVQKFNNALTAEEIQRLQQKVQQFSLGITEEEYLRGVCNHRNAEGTADTLVIDPVTGKVRCATCGYEFSPVEPNMTPEELQDDVNRIVDILQTIKLLYIDLPADAARNYFQIIPMLEKIPQLGKKFQIVSFVPILNYFCKRTINNTTKLKCI